MTPSRNSTRGWTQVYHRHVIGVQEEKGHGHCPFQKIPSSCHTVMHIWLPMFCWGMLFIWLYRFHGWSLRKERYDWHFWTVKIYTTSKCGGDTKLKHTQGEFQKGSSCYSQILTRIDTGSEAKCRNRVYLTALHKISSWSCGELLSFLHLRKWHFSSLTPGLRVQVPRSGIPCGHLSGYGQAPSRKGIL